LLLIIRITSILFFTRNLRHDFIIGHKIY